MKKQFLALFIAITMILSALSMSPTIAQESNPDITLENLQIIDGLTFELEYKDSNWLNPQSFHYTFTAPNEQITLRSKFSNSLQGLRIMRPRILRLMTP
jgi:hypothetical protein